MVSLYNILLYFDEYSNFYLLIINDYQSTRFEIILFLYINT